MSDLLENGIVHEYVDLVLQQTYFELMEQAHLEYDIKLHGCDIIDPNTVVPAYVTELAREYVTV